MFLKIKDKIKNFFCLIDNYRKREEGFLFIPIGYWIGTAVVGAVLYFVGGKVITDAAKDVLTAIMIGVGNILYYIARYLAYLSTSLFNEAIRIIDNKTTTDPVFISGWAEVRNLSNMLIVLGFVVVGIATTLRLREYEAKKLLPLLILIALLINFSGLFCGIMIDSSRVLMKTFLATGGGGTAGNEMYELIRVSAQKLWDSPQYAAASLDDRFILVWGMAILWLVVAITFFYLSFIFVARYAVIALLYILSPLAFFCWIFPQTKKIWNTWWDNFIKWTFIGVGGSFFLWIAIKILNSYNSGGGTILPEQILVVLLFMIVGMKIITNSSAMGAGAVMGLAGGVAGFAMGAGKKVGGAALELGGRTRAGQWTRDKVSNIGNRIAAATGFAKEGSPALKAAEREKKEIGTVDALRKSSNPGDKSRYEQLVKSGQGARGAAAVALANEHGDLAKIVNPDNTNAGLNQMNTRMGLARSFGHERSEFEKKNYQLRQFNENSVNDSLKAKGINPTTASAAQKTQAQKDVMMTQLADNMPQMSINEFGKIDSTHLGVANHEFTRENLTPHMVEKIGVSPNRALIAGIKADLGNFQADLAAAQTAGDKAETNKLQKIINSINKLP